MTGFTRLNTVTLIWALALAAIGGALACAEPGTPAHIELVVRDSLALPSAGAPGAVSDVSDLTVTRENLVIADQDESRITLIDRATLHIDTIGVPGDGPRGLRGPFSALLSGAGVLNVADRGHRNIARWRVRDTLDVRVPWGGYVARRVLAATDSSVTVSGAFRIDTQYYRIAELGRSGQLLRAILPFQYSAGSARANYQRTVAAESQGRAWVGDAVSDSIWIVDLGTGRVMHTIQLPAGLRRAVDWSDKRARKLGSSDVREWALQQSFIMDVVPIGANRALVTMTMPRDAGTVRFATLCVGIAEAGVTRVLDGELRPRTALRDTVFATAVDRRERSSIFSLVVTGDGC